MSGTIDPEMFPGESEFDALNSNLGGAPEAGAQGGAKGPVKPFPIMKFLIGFGLFILVLGGAFIFTMKRGSSSQDQMQSIPQPQMAAPAPQNVPPLPQGGLPPGAQQGMGGNPNVVQPQMQTGMQPQVGMQPQQGMQAGVPPSPVAEPPAVGQQAPGGQYAQPQPQLAQAQPVVSQPSPVQSISANVAQPQPALAQPVAVAKQHHRHGAVTDAGQPIGPEPTAAPSGTGTAPDPSQIAALRQQIDDLSKRLNQLGGSNGTQARSEAAPDSPAPTAKHREHTRPAHKAKTAKGTKVAVSSGSQDGGYVLTGMIDNRAFVSRKGTGDVNSSITLAPGDKLDDGRQVIQVDAKNRRVWLSGGKYIGLPSVQGGVSSDDQSGDTASSSDQ